jgi:hypothetical protein
VTVAFPTGLRGLIRTAKVRARPASFVMPSPREGYGHPEASGRDVPVTWEAKFVFNQADAQTFVLWFRNDINNGADEFTMPIKTEFGSVTQTVRFAPDGVLDARQLGELWEYSAHLIARTLA